VRLIQTLPLLAIVALVATSGCGEDVPDQLEGLSISASSAADGSLIFGDVVGSGVLAVTGQGRDFQLDVDADGLVFDAHLRFVGYDQEAEEVATCGRPPDVLSFEMLRVDAPPSTEPVLRPANLPVNAAGC
jgi:hypothetical protein